MTWSSIFGKRLGHNKLCSCLQSCKARYDFIYFNGSLCVDPFNLYSCIYPCVCTNKRNLDRDMPQMGYNVEMPLWIIQNNKWWCLKYNRYDTMHWGEVSILLSDIWVVCQSNDHLLCIARPLSDCSNKNHINRRHATILLEPKCKTDDCNA